MSEPTPEQIEAAARAAYPATNFDDPELRKLCDEYRARVSRALVAAAGAAPQERASTTTTHALEDWQVYVETACAVIDCDHTGECPTTTAQVCRECLRIAETASPGWSETRFDLALVRWPCAAAFPALNVEEIARAIEPDSWKLADDARYAHLPRGARDSLIRRSMEAAERVAAAVAATSSEPVYEYGKKRAIIDGWERGDRIGAGHYVDPMAVPDFANVRRIVGPWEEFDGTQP